MAERKRNTERSSDKGEVAVASAEAAMGRFRLLARKLVRVPRDELDAKRKPETVERKK